MEGKTTKRDETQDGNKLVAVLSFAAVIIIIGVPVWWKTTETFRVALPYDAIDNLRTIRLFFKVKVHVVVVGDTVDAKTLTDLKSTLKSDFEANHDVIVEENYDLTVRHLNSEENRALQRSKSVSEFSHLLSSQSDVPGLFIVYVFPSDKCLRGHDASIFISRHRFAFVKRKADLRSVAPVVKHVVQTVLVNHESLQTAAANIKQPHLIQPDKKTMRTVLSSPEYDIIFSLINPEPDVIRTSWKIKEAIDAYLGPLLTKLSSVAEFNVKSQVLYLTSLGVQPSLDAQRKGHHLTVDQLPHVINPLEAKLGSFVSINPSLNFIVYVPSRDESPLNILDANGDMSPTNAFLSPRWGGIMIYNVPSPVQNASLPVQVDIDMHAVMEVFLTELRLLLGLNMMSSSPEMQFEAFDGTSLVDWELDYLYRKRTLENIATSSSTLASLAELLEKIGNIVINEKVGSFVFEAVEAAQTSLALLAEGDVVGAFLASKRSYVSSENAFFDPSMLALLYFPDDQKYAVYVPLFIPVGIPVVLSIWHLIKTTLVKRKTHEKLD